MDTGAEIPQRSRAERGRGRASGSSRLGWAGSVRSCPGCRRRSSSSSRPLCFSSRSPRLQRWVLAAADDSPDGARLQSRGSGRRAGLKAYAVAVVVIVVLDQRRSRHRCDARAHRRRGGRRGRSENDRVRGADPRAGHGRTSIGDRSALAPPAGFEPAAHGVETRRSIRTELQGQSERAVYRCIAAGSFPIGCRPTGPLFTGHTIRVRQRAGSGSSSGSVR